MDFFGGEQFENEGVDLSQVPPIPDEVLRGTEDIRVRVNKFKEQLYDEVVQRADYEPGDMRPMYEYVGLLLQSLGYWMSLLGELPQNPPIFQARPSLQESFDRITNTIQTQSASSIDSSTLIYQVLDSIKTDHEMNFPLNQAKNLEQEEEED